jgi:acetylornithine deacetylase
MHRESPRRTEAARDARRLLRPLREQTLALAQALVRVDTVAIPPDGHETAAQRVLARALRRHGIDVELYDTGFLSRSRHPFVRRDRRYRGRHNLVARVPGTGRGRSLLLSGHVDTVPAGPSPWRDDPWSGAIRRGRLYGRGSWDMKGGLAAQCTAAIALRRAGLRPGGDLILESVVDEEFAGGGGTLAGRLRGITAEACAIAEPTSEAVLHASRGGHFFDVVCRAGDPSAYFSKEVVVSPAVPMGRLLGWIEAWTARRRQVDPGPTYRDFPDPAPVQVLAVEANRFLPDVPWSVPLEARVRVYFQFLPHEDVGARVAEIEASLRDFAAADPFFREHPLEVRRLVDPPLEGHELAADHPWTRCLHAAECGTLGPEAPLTAAEWPCDAFLSQTHFGVPTLVFGPRGAGAHNADEYVETASVLRTAEVYLTAALEWCGV